MFVPECRTSFSDPAGGGQVEFFLSAPPASLSPPPPDSSSSSSSPPLTADQTGKEADQIYQLRDGLKSDGRSVCRVKLGLESGRLLAAITQ